MLKRSGSTDCGACNGAINGLEPDLLVTNCLFQRVALLLQDNASNTLSFYNNLFEAGSLTANHTAAGKWTFCDNLFDQAVISQPDNPMDVTANNGSVTNFDYLLPTNINDAVLPNSPSYEPGRGAGHDAQWPIWRHGDGQHKQPHPIASLHESDLSGLDAIDQRQPDERELLLQRGGAIQFPQPLLSGRFPLIFTEGNEGHQEAELNAKGARRKDAERESKNLELKPRIHTD